MNLLPQAVAEVPGKKRKKIIKPNISCNQLLELAQVIGFGFVGNLEDFPEK